MKSRTVVIFAAALYLATMAEGQAVKTAEQILAEPAVHAAMQSIQANEPHFIEEQVHLTEIPSPPFHETARALEMKRLFAAAGLQNVRIDETGNVLGDRPGTHPHPHLVIAAHLDTVFPEGTDVHVKRNGTLLTAPGIGDDDRGLVAMLALIDAMQKAKLVTQGSVTFVADVGEEGLGDSRGTKALFETTLKGQIDEFISIDGDRVSSVVNTGVGSYRYRVTFTGPGGHSYGAFGIANPIHAMGRAIDHISQIDVPAKPKTTYSVGRVGGGTSVNSIPYEAWFEFDERSADVASLDAVDVKFKAAVQTGLDEENAFRHDKGKLSVKIESVGIRPAGQTSPDAPIIQAARASVEALHLGEFTVSESSTDSNVPMHLGIPAMTMGGGGKGNGAHFLQESFDTTDSYKGVQNLLLTTLILLQ
jgi:tripeptide aminopeptidase